MKKLFLLSLFISFNLNAGFWDKLEKVTNKMDKIEEKEDKIIDTKEQAKRIEDKKRKAAGIKTSEQIQEEKDKEEENARTLKMYERQICAQHKIVQNMKKDPKYKDQYKLMEPQYEANIETLHDEYKRYSKGKSFNYKKECK